MKKQFSITFLSVVIALVAVVCGWLVSVRSNQRLQAEIEGVRETLQQTEEMVDSQSRLLAQARLGSTLLYRMAQSKEYEEVFDLISTIPNESLSCRIMELPEHPSVQLVSYHHYRFNADGSILPIDECKSATILVKTESLEVVDYNIHNGFGSIKKSSVEPFYVLCGDNPDGTIAKHTVLPTGFEPHN